MEKKCAKCKDPKELTEFYRNRIKRDGRTNWCKNCLDTANKKSWAKNSKNYAAKRKATGLMYKFGITMDEYNEILAAQEKCCAICGEALGNDGHQPCVDHDHSKKGRESVRGIVHRKCNIYLGYVEKNTELFGKINQYLEKHGAGADTASPCQEGEEECMPSSKTQEE